MFMIVWSSRKLLLGCGVQFLKGENDYSHNNINKTVICTSNCIAMFNFDKPRMVYSVVDLFVYVTAVKQIKTIQLFKETCWGSSEIRTFRFVIWTLYTKHAL